MARSIPLRPSRDRVVELWRYYQAGVANTIVGYGLYALFVRVGFNIYAAQLTAHMLGMGFNYLTYTRHVFRGARPAKRRYVAAYAINYLIGLGSLIVAKSMIGSPYAAGAAAVVLASIINYFILRHIVFVRRTA